jgi:hypothetical protein
MPLQLHRFSRAVKLPDGESAGTAVACKPSTITNGGISVPEAFNFNSPLCAIIVHTPGSVLFILGDVVTVHDHLNSDGRADLGHNPLFDAPASKKLLS